MSGPKIETNLETLANVAGFGARLAWAMRDEHCPDHRVALTPEVERQIEQAALELLARMLHEQRLDRLTNPNRKGSIRDRPLLYGVMGEVLAYDPAGNAPDEGSEPPRWPPESDTDS